MDGQEGWVFALYLVVWIDTNRLIVTVLEPTQPPVARVDSFALGGHVMDLTDRAFGLARSAEMTWVKVQHRYYVGQNAGQELGAAIQSAHDHSFKILLGIVGDQGQMGDLASYSANYAAFVADVAALGADADRGLERAEHRPRVARRDDLRRELHAASRCRLHRDQGESARNYRDQRRARADRLFRRRRLRHRRLQRRHLLQADGGGGRCQLSRLRRAASQRRHRLAD